MIRLDDDLEKIFPWLTRTGMGRHFGSVPIGWYQQHQMCALRTIEKVYERKTGTPTARNLEMRVRDGVVYARNPGSRWQYLLGTLSVFDAADACARGEKKRWRGYIEKGWG